jgi:flagellar hook assembly protein FlgD
VLTFEPVKNGISTVVIAQSWPGGSPVLVDRLNESLAVETSHATITVGTTVDVEETPPITVVKLHQNYPNPFNPRTAIRFDLPSSSTVFIRIYDANGRLVRTLVDGREYPPGSREEGWNGENDSDKLVFYSADVNDFSNEFEIFQVPGEANLGWSSINSTATLRDVSMGGSNVAVAVGELGEII